MNPSEVIDLAGGLSQQPAEAEDSLIVEPDGPKYRGTWMDAAGVSGSELFASEAAAVNHVARHQAGGLRFHDLRHSYATWLVDDGVPVNMVQRVLG